MELLKIDVYQDFLFFCKRGLHLYREPAQAREVGGMAGLGLQGRKDDENQTGSQEFFI